MAIGGQHPPDHLDPSFELGLYGCIHAQLLQLRNISLADRACDHNDGWIHFSGALRAQPDGAVIGDCQNDNPGTFRVSRMEDFFPRYVTIPVGKPCAVASRKVA